MSIYDCKVKNRSGEDVSISDYIVKGNQSKDGGIEIIAQRLK